MTKAKKIELFQRLFRGRPDVHGIVNPETGTRWLVEKPLTGRVIEEHLSGKRQCGIFLSSDMLWVTGVRVRGIEAVRGTLSEYHRRCLPCAIETLVGGWFRFWLFFESAVGVWKIEEIYRQMDLQMNESGTVNQLEFWSDSSYPVFLPLPCYPPSMRRSHTGFLDGNFEFLADPFEHLASIPKVSEKHIDVILTLYGRDHENRSARISHIS